MIACESYRKEGGTSCNGSHGNQVPSVNKEIWEIFTEEETTEPAPKGGIEVWLWWEVEGKFKGAGWPCAKTWRCEKAQSIQGIARMYYG